MMYCLDTDIISKAIDRDPPRRLLRRLVTVPFGRQLTSAITLSEILYGVAKRQSPTIAARLKDFLENVIEILPFDEAAGGVYGPLRAQLEHEGRRLAEPDLRIASIALARDLTLVTGNVKHFARVPGLQVENWFE